MKNPGIGMLPGLFYQDNLIFNLTRREPLAFFTHFLAIHGSVLSNGEALDAAVVRRKFLKESESKEKGDTGKVF